VADQDNLNGIIERILNGNQAEGDIEQLRRSLAVSDNQIVLQVGNNIVNIAEGEDIHIADRIYQGADAETIRRIFQELLDLNVIAPTTLFYIYQYSGQF
jgi:hypothetical protein